MAVLGPQWRIESQPRKATTESEGGSVGSSIGRQERRERKDGWADNQTGEKDEGEENALVTTSERFLKYSSLPFSAA
jgi:hypothetical protein